MNQDKFDYFIQRTDRDISEIKGDVKRLLAFKWQIVGGAVVLSALVSTVISIYFKG